MPGNGKTTTSQRQRGRAPLLSSEECKAIAAEYDGTTAALDRLLVAYRRRHPGLERHNVVQAARRGGYATRRIRKAWSPADDDFLREQSARVKVLVASFMQPKIGYPYGTGSRRRPSRAPG